MNFVGVVLFNANIVLFELSLEFYVFLIRYRAQSGEYDGCDGVTVNHVADFYTERLQPRKEHSRPWVLKLEHKVTPPPTKFNLLHQIRLLQL